jgi:hypothetical protein
MHLLLCMGRERCGRGCKNLKLEVDEKSNRKDGINCKLGDKAMQGYSSDTEHSHEMRTARTRSQALQIIRDNAMRLVA